MRLRFPELAALAATSVMTLAVAGPATAASVSTSPGGAVTATATTHVFVRAGSFSVDCTTMTVTATLAGATGAAFPLVISSNTQPHFSGCSIVSIGGIPISCTNTSRLSVTGVTVSDVTPVRADIVSCTITFTGVCGASFAGSMNTSYNNFTRQLTLSATGQTLTVSGSTCGSLLPNGPMTITGPTGSNSVFNVSPTQTITAT